MSEKIYIQYPVYRYAEPETEDCFNEMMKYMIAKGYEVYFDKPRGESMITRIRNRCLSRAIGSKTEFDWIMHIDSDLVFDPDLIERLLSHGKDAVGAIYRVKDYKRMYSSSVPKGKEDIHWKDNKLDMYNGLTEMKYVSGGCFLVNMKVIKKLIEKYQDLKYYDDFSNKVIYGFYNPLIREFRGKKRLLSEDWSFCERIRESGFQIWADTDIIVGHLMTAPLFFEGKVT
jgi:hypothetical protein